MPRRTQQTKARHLTIGSMDRRPMTFQFIKEQQ